MAFNFQIGEISRFFDVPASTLRYWEDMGVLNPLKEQRGLTIPADLTEQFPDSQILWKKQSNKYITFLMKEEIADGFPNDLQKHLLHIQSSHKTGAMISRFLLCAKEDGKIYDFYKTFVEILS